MYYSRIQWEIWKSRNEICLKRNWRRESIWKEVNSLIFLIWRSKSITDRLPHIFSSKEINIELVAMIQTWSSYLFQGPADCCPGWSLGGYIALMFNRTSCFTVQVPRKSAVQRVMHSEEYIQYTKYMLNRTPGCTGIVNWTVQHIQNSKHTICSYQLDIMLHLLK